MVSSIDQQFPVFTSNYFFMLNIIKIKLPNLKNMYRTTPPSSSLLFVSHPPASIYLGDVSLMRRQAFSSWWDLGDYFAFHIKIFFSRHVHHFHKNNQSSTAQTSLVVQWLRIRLPMQGTRVQALVREDHTRRGATKPVRHNYWARVPQLLSPCATTTEARVPRARAPQQEKPLQWEARSPKPRVAPARHN